MGIGAIPKNSTRQARDAAAAFARALSNQPHLAFSISPELGSVPPSIAAQAVVEGCARPVPLPASQTEDRPPPTLESFTVVGAKGRSTDLRREQNAEPSPTRAAGWPAISPTRRRPAERPTRLAGSSRRKSARAAAWVWRSSTAKPWLRLGCGRPARGQCRQRRGPSDDQAHLPSEGHAPAATWRSSARASCSTPAVSGSSPTTVHATMKKDMSGAGAILAAMSALHGAGLPRRGHRLSHVH